MNLKEIYLLAISCSFSDLELLIICSIDNFHFSRTLLFKLMVIFLYNLPSFEFLPFYLNYTNGDTIIEHQLWSHQSSLWAVEFMASCRKDSSRASQGIWPGRQGWV